VVAAATAILVSFPLPYGQTTVTVENLRSWWTDSVPVAEAAVSDLRLRALTTARRTNAVKAGVLCAARAAELGGLILLTVTVINIINS
jgi:hypothetical protein